MLQTKALIRDHQRELLVFVFLLAAFFPTMLWMWDRWFADNSYYSHGILIPVISAFLIWKKRAVLKKIPVKPSHWGFELFSAGVILYWASAILHVYFTSGFAMIIILAGLILYFYGERTLKEIRFPVLFLAFMVPMPIILVAFVCFKLKIIAAHLATLVLNLMGLPALQQSSLIMMSHSYVEVEDSCGGLRSLISLAALGSIFAYRLKLRLSKKILLFASAIPIAVVTNALRIVFLAAVGEIWGTQYTQGFLHGLSGYMVFIFAFLMLFTVKKLLT